MVKYFINENKRLFLLFIGSLIFNILLFVFYSYPLYVKSGEILSNTAELKEKNQDLSRDWMERGEAISRIESTLSVIDTIENRIIGKEGGLEEYIAQLEKWNRELGLSVVDLNFRYDPLDNGLLRVSSNLRLRSSYQNLKKLLYNFENHEKLIITESISINESPLGIIEMQIAFSAYFYEERYGT